MSIKITLGRDGMGSEATEADFDAWVAYVNNRIEERVGYYVEVDTRRARDVQDDLISCDNDGSVREALDSLWDYFCADTSAWPTRQ